MKHLMGNTKNAYWQFQDLFNIYEIFNTMSITVLAQVHCEIWVIRGLITEPMPNTDNISIKLNWKMVCFKKEAGCEFKIELYDML